MQYRVPYGYKIIDGEIVIAIEQQVIVAEIFQKYDKGISMLQIANSLKERDIPYTSGVSTWNTTIVGQILKRKAYLGDVYYPRIIDQDLYNRVQERRFQYNRHIGRGEFRPDKEERELFNGKIVCDECEIQYRRYRPPRPKSVSAKAKWSCRHRNISENKKCPVDKFTDQQVMEICRRAINKIIRNKQLVKNVDEPPQILSREFTELDEQINTLSINSADDAVPIFAKRVAERYKTLEVRNVRPLTEVLLKLIDGKYELEQFDAELYRKIVKEIRIYSGHAARVVFINGCGVLVRI